MQGVLKRGIIIGNIGISIVLLLQLLPAHSATSVKAGSACNKAGTTKVYDGKKFTCIKNGKKLVWNKGVSIAKPSPSPTASKFPEPTPAPTPAITLTPSPSPTPVSLSERWNQTGSQALIAFDKWAAKSDGKTPSVTVNYIISANLWPEVQLELKRRMSNVIAFFDPYIKPTLPIYFFSGRFEDMEWACTELFRLDPGRTVESCRRQSLDQQSRDYHDSWGGGMGTSSAHWYLLKMKEAVDGRAFLPRVEHEYIHTIQQNQLGSFSDKVTCWYHGMAEYLGILASAQGDLIYFLDQRNSSILGAPVPRPSQLTAEFLINWLNRASIMGYAGGVNQCQEFDETGDYHDAILAAEWMVLKLGLPGVLEFQGDLKNMSWNQAIEKYFKAKPAEIYTEIGKYMFAEIQIARSNNWARIETCRAREPGPIKDPVGCRFR